MKGQADIRRAGIWFALFAGLTLAVQARWAAPLDDAAMRLVATYRPEPLAGPMNWAFRLGFLQVDLALALLLSVWLLARRRPWPVVLAPLLIVVGVGVQAGLRLVVEQPSPSGFELQRVTPAQPVGYMLDRADAAARQSLVAVTAAVAPTGAPSEERGSYPSGHACRVLFLALAVMGLGRGAVGTGRRGDQGAVTFVQRVIPDRPPVQDANIVVQGISVCHLSACENIGVGQELTPCRSAALESEGGALLSFVSDRAIGRAAPAAGVRGSGLRTQESGLICRLLLAAVALLVGYSAIYFGYHWPSDVLGGYLLALAAYPLAGWVRRRG